MTLLDVNILIYAASPESPFHARTSAWLERLSASGDLIGLPWHSLAGLIRISTDPRLTRNPRNPTEVFQNVRDWLSQPGVVPINPGPLHLNLLERMVVEARVAAPRISDAVLAALAIENGATLASTDRDFSRFPGLKWVNPLD